jgi:hypothetical protein
MYVRKCSRCEEKTSTMYGGKKIGEEFLCEKCVKKAEEAGEIEPSSQVDEPTNYLSIKILKVVSIIYFILSIIVPLYTWASITNGIDPGEIPIANSMGTAFLLSLVQSTLIFCAIWAFIILVETVLKIYHKMK